jgi:hypothetical protein
VEKEEGMSLTGSIIGALVAFVARPRRALVDETTEISALRRRVEDLDRNLQLAHEVTALWRDEALRLRAGAHRCQHQADLNRAMAQQAQAQYPQMGLSQKLAQAAQSPEAMQAYYSAAQNLGALIGQAQSAQGCRLSLEDCGMHRAEMVGRLSNALRNPHAQDPRP